MITRVVLLKVLSMDVVARIIVSTFFTGRKWQWNVGLICVDLMNASTESDIYREQLTT